MNSYMSYIGGKKTLKKKIIAEFPERYERYIEVFGGAGWVLFDKEQHAKFEVFNDINGDLIKLYRCIKYHAPAVIDELKYIMHSRETFNNFASQMQTDGLTDIQRAARYYILIRSSFGANSRNFATAVRDISGKIDYLLMIQHRMERVIIENRDFDQIIKTYDRENALFYLDPPYHNAEKYYRCEFSDADHERLCKSLTNIKGKFVLSYNADSYIMDLYKDFNIIPVMRFNTLSQSSNTTEYKELIIKNY